MRILKQLPQYVYICDVAFLVLGPRAKMPDCLPSWVSAYRVNETQDGFELLERGGIKFIESSLPFYKRFVTPSTRRGFLLRISEEVDELDLFSEMFAEFDDVEEVMIKPLAEYNKNRSKRKFLPPEGNFSDFEEFL